MIYRLLVDNKRSLIELSTRTILSTKLSRASQCAIQLGIPIFLAQITECIRTCEDSDVYPTEQPAADYFAPAPLTPAVTSYTLAVEMRTFSAEHHAIGCVEIFTHIAKLIKVANGPDQILEMLRLDHCIEGILRSVIAAKSAAILRHRSVFQMK